MSFFANSSAQSMPAPKTLGVDRTQTPTDEHGRPVPYLFGKTKVGVTFISEPWGFRSSPIVTKVGKDKQVTGYDYYASFAAMICLGPVDALFEIRIDDQTVWSGSLTRDVDDFEPITLEGRGQIRFYWGTDDQAADSAMATDSGITHPAYRGQCYVVCDDFLLGSNAQAPSLTFVVSRYPDPAWLTTGSNVDDDCHPVAIIGDLWSNPRYGLGLSADRLDQDTLNATAATLTTEGVGLSGIVDTSQDWSTMLAKILECVDGYVTTDSLGRFGVKLIRGEVGDGLTFDEDDLTEDPDIQTTAWPDTINQCEVSFRNRDKDWQDDSVAWHDRANYAITGETRTETLQRPWITTQAQAWQIAGAWCRAHALPRISGTIRVRADSAASLEPGDTFRLTFATSGLSAVLCRAESIRTDGPDSPEIEVEFQEDRGYLNSDAYVPDDDTPVTPTEYEAEQVESAFLFETPWGWLQSDHTWFLMAIARGDTYSGSCVNWIEVATDSYVIHSTTSVFALEVQINGSLSATGPHLDDSGNSLDLTMTGPDTEPYDATMDEALAGGALLLIGTEIIAVWEPSLISAGRYGWNYLRGRYGCLRTDIADTTTGYLIFPTNTRPAPYHNMGVAADPGTTHTFKFQPELLGIGADLSAASEYDAVSTARSYRPLAPLNLTANGDGHFPTYATGTDVTVDWDQSSVLRSITPAEEDCADNFTEATVLQLLDTATETVQATISIPTATGPYTLTNAAIQAAMGGETDFILRAYNQRGALYSATYDTVTVTAV